MRPRADDSIPPAAAHRLIAGTVIGLAALVWLTATQGL